MCSFPSQRSRACSRTPYPSGSSPFGTPGSPDTTEYQCCGSMTFWCGSGSGSADPCLWLIDQDPDSDADPSIFIIDLQDANQKIIFLTKFFCRLLFEGTFTSFFKGKKVKKKSQNSRNEGFPDYFCLMIEGSRPGSGSIPLTNGSGSGTRRPKNTWIRNIAEYKIKFFYFHSSRHTWCGLDFWDPDPLLRILIRGRINILL